MCACVCVILFLACVFSHCSKEVSRLPFAMFGLRSVAKDVAGYILNLMSCPVMMRIEVCFHNSVSAVYSTAYDPHLVA